MYTFDRQPMPKSRELLLLHESFMEELRATNKSANTIQSCANSVRQFLLFLEDHDCTSLALASAAMVPAFFQHLLATYRPQVFIPLPRTSARFSDSQKPEERLLLAVPSRCVRNSPIIPILLDHENDALEKVLQNGQLRLRG